VLRGFARPSVAPEACPSVVLDNGSAFLWKGAALLARSGAMRRQMRNQTDMVIAAVEIEAAGATPSAQNSPALATHSQ
jgi:hypothetical protein